MEAALFDVVTKGRRGRVVRADSHDGGHGGRAALPERVKQGGFGDTVLSQLGCAVAGREGDGRGRRRPLGESARVRLRERRQQLCGMSGAEGKCLNRTQSEMSGVRGPRFEIDSLLRLLHLRRFERVR
jgi:hypothetical protein